MKSARALVLFSLLLFSAETAMAANRYVRAGATGANNGTDWTSAYTNLPASLVRGDTYYIAEGSYGSYTFDDANSGTQTITFKKATAADHGTSTGWSDGYGDGQAVFGGLTFKTDYWVIDGTTRDETDWDNGASYGFRVRSVYSNALSLGHCTDNLTVKYADIGATYSTTYKSDYGNVFYLGGFSETCDNWTISRNFIHNDLLLQMAGVNNILIEYNWIGLIWGKEIIRGQVQATNVTIRNNWFENGCRNDGSGTGGGCTAEIALFGNQGDTPNFGGFKAYGNVIWKTTPATTEYKCCGSILVESTDGLIYNNTIVDLSTTGSANLRVDPGSGSSAIRNNILYVPNGISGTCESSGPCDNNSTYTSSPPFVNVNSGLFQLKAPVTGVSLLSPYNIDRNGVVRGADGVWDRGAFEFLAGMTALPAPPSNLRVQ